MDIGKQRFTHIVVFVPDKEGQAVLQFEAMGLGEPKECVRNGVSLDLICICLTSIYTIPLLCDFSKLFGAKVFRYNSRHLGKINISDPIYFF